MTARLFLKRELSSALAMKVILVLLACWRCAYGLNPSLDINQYAHKSWTIREGFSRAASHRLRRRPTVFDGARVVPWQPPAGQVLPDEIISQLRVARDGRLWIATGRGRRWRRPPEHSRRRNASPRRRRSNPVGDRHAFRWPYLRDLPLCVRKFLK
jgi:hypothetical protein